MASRTRRNRLTIAGAALGLAVSASIGGIATATPAAAAGQCVDYQYSIGGSADCVSHIQTLLNAFEPRIPGGYQQLSVDGQFGDQTRSAVVAFQTYWGLSTDGVVGAETWNILCGPQMGPGPIAWYPYDAARAAGCDI